MDVYSESNFWNKVVKYAKIAGKEVIERALQLYYASQDPNLPPWAKTVVFSALAYFIFPVDAIPDLIPGVGYVDDLGVLAAAVVTVALYITEDVKQKARQKLRDWFGDGESV